MIPFFANKLKLAVKARQGPSISYEQQNPPSLRKSMLPANVAVTRKGSWPSETFPMLEKRQSFLEKEMELEGASILLSKKAVRFINQFVGLQSLIRVIEGVDKAKKEAFSTEKGLGMRYGECNLLVPGKGNSCYFHFFTSHFAMLSRR